MGESSEPRIDFLQEFTLKSLRLKGDKWYRMIISDEQRQYIANFIDGRKYFYLLKILRS